MSVTQYLCDTRCNLCLCYCISSLSPAVSLTAVYSVVKSANWLLNQTYSILLKQLLLGTWYILEWELRNYLAYTLSANKDITSGKGLTPLVSNWVYSKLDHAEIIPQQGASKIVIKKSQQMAKLVMV